MKKHIVFTLIFFSLAFHPLAQSNSIPGAIALHNSKYLTNTLQFVEGASIRADSASPTASDAMGQFTLRFSGKEGGFQAAIAIEKAGLEVVNQRDLSSVTIGREAPLKVSMVPPEQLAQAQAELLEISIKALTRRHDELIANLRTKGKKRQQTIALLEQELDTQVDTWQEAEQLLDERLQRLKQELPSTMAALARVNLDEASSTYIEAFELIKAGKVVEALEQLRNGNWAKKAEESLKQLKQLEKSESNSHKAAEEIQGAVEESVKLYHLQADAYTLLFKYKNSMQSAEAALHLLEQTGNAQNLLMADVLDKVAVSNSLVGDFQSTLDLCKQSHNIKLACLDEQDFELALSHHRLASAYLGCGELNKAKQEITQGILVAGILYLVESPAIVPFLTTKSAIERELGNLDQAQKDLKTAMKIESETLSPDDPARSVTLMHFASLQILAGKWDTAEESIREAIRINEANFPEGNPDLADCYANLAQALWGKGQLNVAVEYQMAALDIYEKDFPPYSTYRILSRSNLALYLMALGKPKAALELLLELLEEEDKGQISIAPNHRYLILNNLGAAYTKLKQPRNAIHKLKEAVLIQKNITNGVHPNSVKLYANLAGTYLELEEFDSTWTYLQQALELSDSLLGFPPPDRAALYSLQGSYFFTIDQFEAAEKSLTRSWEAYQEMYGKDHYLTATAEGELASVLYASGRYEEAVEHLGSVLEVYESQASELSNSMAQFHQLLGKSYGKMDSIETAIGHFHYAIKLSQEAPEIDSAALARMYIDLALTYSQNEMLPFAEINMEHAEGILSHMTPMDTNSTIYVYLCQGSILADAGKPKEGLEFQEKALLLSEALSTSDPRSVSISYNNLAYNYNQLASYESALRNSEMAISTFLKSPTDSISKPRLITLYNNHVHMLSNIGLIDSALAYQKKALLLERQVRSKGDPIFDEYKMAFFVLFEDKFPHDYSNPISKEEELKQDLVQYTYILDLFPEDPESYQNLGSAYFFAGKYKKAIRWYKKGIEYDANSAYCHLRIGSTYLEMGKPEKAKEAFSAGMEAAPEDPKVHLGWAIYWASLQQYSMAIDNIQKTLENGLSVVWIKHEKVFAPLTKFDRYNKLLKQYDDR